MDQDNYIPELATEKPIASGNLAQYKEVRNGNISDRGE